MKNCGLIEIKANGVKKEEYEDSFYKDIWTEYVLILKENNEYMIIPFIKGCLLRIINGRKNYYNFLNTVSINNDCLSLTQLPEIKEYNFFYFGKRKDTIEEIFNQILDVDSKNSFEDNMDLAYEADAKSDIENGEYTLEEFIYTSGFDTPLSLNEKSITEEEFLKEFGLRDIDLEWRNLREYCGKSGIDVKDIMGKIK